MMQSFLFCFIINCIPLTATIPAADLSAKEEDMSQQKVSQYSLREIYLYLKFTE